MKFRSTKSYSQCIAASSRSGLSICAWVVRHRYSVVFFRVFINNKTNLMTLFLCEYQVKSAVEHANKSYRNFIYWTSFASAHTHTNTACVTQPVTQISHEFGAAVRLSLRLDTTNKMESCTSCLTRVSISMFDI